MLNLATLPRIPRDARPRVLPGSVPAGIVHIGVGAFHRAHQAVYTEEALAAAGGDWGIIGVAPRSADVVDRLAAQDNLFSVASLSSVDTTVRVVGSLAGVRHAGRDPAAVVALLADPAIRVVTLTLTEKGYRIRAAVDGRTGSPAGDPVRCSASTPCSRRNSPRTAWFATSWSTGSPR